MKHIAIGFMIGLALVLVALVIYFGTEPVAAYQSEHISTGLDCGVTVYGEHPVQLEDRSSCGGTLALTMPWVEFAAGYMHCMATVDQPPASVTIDQSYWYAWGEYFDWQGLDCAGYLKHMPEVVQGPVEKFGRLVRKSAIYEAAP